MKWDTITYDVRNTKEIIQLTFPKLYLLNKLLQYKKVMSMEGNGMYDTITIDNKKYEIKITQKKDIIKAVDCDNFEGKDKEKALILNTIKNALQFMNFRGIAFHKGKLIIEDMMKSYEISIVKKMVDFK